MKKTICKKFKKVSSRILSVMMIIVMAGTMLPANAVVAKEQEEKYPYTLFAASDKEGAITVNAGNFCVNGDIAANGTIVSSGNMNLNGTKTEHANLKMVHITESLKKDYFTGDGVIEHTGDYDCEETNVNINSPMYIEGKAALSGNISMNAGIMAQGDITLCGGVINTNNSIICSKTGNITVDSSNVNLNGLIYAPHGRVKFTSQNLNLNNIIIIADSITLKCSGANVNYSTGMGKVVGAGSEADTDTEIDIDTEIFAFGGYNAEKNSIDIEWYTEADKGNFEIWISDDNKEYKKAASVKDKTSYQYLITEEFETKYFKVVLTGKGGSVESVPFIVTKSGDGYESDFLDSDGDGLYDFVEITCGTDINKKDTDDDGLTDYQEACLTETDPLKYDSVKKGISDAEADSDGDGLSNIREVELGTEPKTVDTDKDGLTDGEEVNVYGTDPLLYDTDGDGLKDGDEPPINLDPKNPKTYGIPDAEYRVKQKISADSSVLSEINTPESPYKLSVDITAAGYVEGNLTAKETGYAKVIQNDSMLGLAPELTYNNPEAIESVTLKFEISPEYEENVLGLFPEVEELNGIKRLNVFKYFEDINMLLPIETKFDLDKNIVYTEVDELGTYCLMDMEQWFVSLGILGEEYQPQPMLFSLASSITEVVSLDKFSLEDSKVEYRDDVIEEEHVTLFSSERRLSFAPDSRKDVTPIDVVMVLQASGRYIRTFNSQKEMIIDVMEKLIKEYDTGNVRFCVITYGISETEILRGSTNSIWFTDSDELRNKLKNVTYDLKYSSYEYANRANAFYRLMNDVKFKENASKFIFQLMNGVSYAGDLYFDQISTCKRLGINYSELMPEQIYYIDEGYKREVDDAIAETKGMNITYIPNQASTDVYNHIIKNAAAPQVKFDAIVPSGWKEITLDGILERGSKVDTDGDKLPDWDEVEEKLIEWNTDGSVKLPSLLDCYNYVKKDSSEDKGKSYAEDGFERFREEKGWPLQMPLKDLEAALSEVFVLPIKSDPTDEDTDGDGLLDGEPQYRIFWDRTSKQIAPIDPEPMKYTGAPNMWRKHIEEMGPKDIGISEFTERHKNVGTNYFFGIGMDIDVYEDETEPIIKMMFALRNDINKNKKELKKMARNIKKELGDKKFSMLGACLLNFKYDDKLIAYHSQNKTWQRSFGYNEFYDEIFKIASNMDCGRIDIVIGDEQYALWAWKGDYWNLRYGAEVGLYKKNKVISTNEIDHYDAVDFEVPMTLSLYYCEDKNNYDPVFHWVPQVPKNNQWWITGFSPEYKPELEPDPSKMAVIASVDLREHLDIFNVIKDTYKKEMSENELQPYHVFCDERTKTVWIQWYN